MGLSTASYVFWSLYFLFYKIKQFNYTFECLKLELQDKMFPSFLIIIWSILSIVKTKQTTKQKQNIENLFVQ